MRPLPRSVALLAAPALCLLTLSACWSTATAPPVQVVRVPAAWKGKALDPTSSTRSLVLDRLPMTLALPETNRAADEGERSAFLFSGSQLRQQEGGAATVPVPFYVSRSERRMAPPGMRVWVDGEEASFATNLSGGSRASGASWTFRGDDLLVRNNTEGLNARSILEVKVLNPQVLLSARRINWSEARADGMTAQDFVRYGMSTVAPDSAKHDTAQQSREGLLLPAPASATWADLTIPPAAAFQAWTAMVPPPIGSASDGAAVELTWTTATGEVLLGQQTLHAVGEPFQAWNIDLAAIVGQTGTLRLTSKPVGNNIDDYVFVAAPAIIGTPSGRTRHVVVIGVDTLRPDHLGVYGYTKRTSPELDAWARDAVVFDEAWTTAPRTRPSFRSSTTGRLPLDAVCAKNIGGVFDEAGFATAGIVANPHLNPRFDFQSGFDLWWLDGDAKADDEVDRAIGWLESQKGRDTYLFLHLMDPHVNYIAPGRFVDPFIAELPPLPADDKLPLPGRTGRSDVYRMMSRNQLTGLDQQTIEARYNGEVAFTSFELNRMLEYVATLPGDSVVVIHSDHGEEFWEHAGYEHNHQIYNETTKAVMIIKPPGGTGAEGMRSAQLATLQDLGPTLYSLAGLTNTPPTDGVSLVPGMRGEPTDEDRALPVGYIQFNADRWGLVWRNHKYILWTGSGQQELYDLVSDPAERADLIGSADTTEYWQKLGIAHHVGVGPGWRINIRMDPGTQLDIQLPAKALAADVLDPELVTRHPANQEWGEVPPVSKADVGEFTLAEDGMSAHLTVGPKGQGILYVRFDKEQDAAQVQVTGLKQGVLQPVEHVINTQEGRMTFLPGIVLVPPASEFERMQQCVTRAGSVSEKQMLQDLGYMSGSHGPDEHGD